MSEKPAAHWERVESFKALADRHAPTEHSKVGEDASEKRSLHLFYDHDHTVEVALLSEKAHGYSYQRGGLEDVHVRGFRNEPDLIWELLHHPCMDLVDLKARRLVFEALLSDEKVLSGLHQELSRAYTLSGACKSLLEASYDEKEKAERERRTPKRRIEELIQGGITTEFVRANFTEEPYGVNATEERPLMEALFCLWNVGKGAGFVRDFATCLEKQENPTLREMGGELREKAKELPPITSEGFLQEAIDNPSFESLKAKQKKIEHVTNTIAQIGAILSAAMHAESDEFGCITYDPSRPREYSEGWNFLKQKSNYDYSTHGQIAQVKNDAPADNPVTVLCGGNMSGKSFTLNADLYGQLWAQTFGRIPAASGNFPVLHDSFVFLDRASTDATHDLSAFGKEIQQLQKGIDACRSRPAVWSDEFGSTTSPEDQFALSAALVLYLRSHNARITMANHNEQFLRWCQQMAECGMYHFATGTKENGDIAFLHTMKPGIDESHAIEVAERMGMPKEVIQTAASFIDGNSSTTETPSFRAVPIAMYSPEEREALKQQPRSPRIFFPHADELIIENSRWGKRIDWHYTERDSSTGGRKTKDTAEAQAWERAKLEPFFLCLSEDKDFRYHLPHTLMPGKPETFGRMAQELLYTGPTSDSKEILERQHMFDLLTEGNTATELLDDENEVWRFLRAVVNSGGEGFDEFNTLLLENISKEFTDPERNTRGIATEDIDILISIIRLNADVLSLDLASLRVEEDIALLLKIKDIQSACQQKEANQEDRLSWRQYEERAYQTAAPAYALVGLEREAYAHDQCRKPARVVIERIMQKLTPHLAPVSFYTCDPKSLRPHFETMAASVKSLSERNVFMFRPECSFIFTVRSLLREQDAIPAFLQKLRSLDSVHLHRLAGHFERLLECFLHGKTSGSAVLEHLKAMAQEKKEDPHKYPSLESEWRATMHHGTFENIEEELSRLSSIFAFAQTMKEEGYCRVGFNDTGELLIQNGWSVAKPKGEQVRNDSTFSPEQRVQLATGANMSGKTFDIKKVDLAILAAQATGYAPAAAMHSPIHTSVVYLDRVNSNNDENLSAFGNEVMHWKSLFERSEGGHVFFGIDEAFSTTSPKYQGALSYGICSHLGQKGHRIYLASHHHQFIDAFASRYPESSSAHHFHTQLQPDGTLTFDYKKQSGHQPSQALAVARTLGMNPEILAFAELIKPVPSARLPSHH
ncbi:MAG: hypothetical protein PHX87_03335 [Candidatus Peribacteraceae bacterium]|nr:hypothetical protein [Candidatus Peribacteraceae bacterium]MDD5742440.1 hypothetical protein [Candidatus Peribacteraceae bacterium]